MLWKNIGWPDAGQWRINGFIIRSPQCVHKGFINEEVMKRDV